MLAIDEAIKTRWAAASLSTWITGGIHFERAIEDGDTGTDFPYCSYSHVSNGRIGASRSSALIRKTVQFKVYARDPDDARAFAEKVVQAFTNSNYASSNPLAVAASDGVLLSVEENGDPVAEQEADEVYSARFDLNVVYSRNRNLRLS